MFKALRLLLGLIPRMKPFSRPAGCDGKLFQPEERMLSIHLLISAHDLPLSPSSCSGSLSPPGVSVLMGLDVPVPMRIPFQTLILL